MRAGLYVLTTLQAGWAPNKSSSESTSRLQRYFVASILMHAKGHDFIVRALWNCQDLSGVLLGLLDSWSYFTLQSPHKQLMKV